MINTAATRLNGDRKESQLKEIWRRMRKNKAAMVGLVIFLIFVAVALLADVIVPYDMAITQNGAERLLPPAPNTGSAPTHTAAMSLPG